MLLCSGPLTNTIQSWVKPSTVGFFLTWARCPSSSFTWTAHCEGRGGERPVSARGTRGWAGGRGHTGKTVPGTRPEEQKRKGTAATLRRKAGPRDEGVKALSPPAAGGRGEARPPARGTVLRARADGGRCQGRAVPPPGASTPGAPGAAAGPRLRRHPPPPSGCLRAPCRCRERRAARESREQSEVPRHANPFPAAPGPRYSPSWPCLGRRHRRGARSCPPPPPRCVNS